MFQNNLSLASAISDCIDMYSVLYIHVMLSLSLRNIWLRVYIIKFIACQTRYFVIDWYRILLL